jgi:hypothetical protein
MRYRHDLVFQQPQCQEAAFTVGFAIVVSRERKSLKYLWRVHEIDAVLTEIRPSLGFVPREHDRL